MSTINKTYDYINNSVSSESFVSYFIIVIIFIILIMAISYTIYMNNLDKSECKYMDKLYSSIRAVIHSININDPACSGKLYDYNIKSSYNACSGGSYANDFVDICNLKSIIKEGVRFLDFAIYSIDNKPVVATSTTNNYYVKETFNYVDFKDVMTTIKNYAFTTGTAPNNKDPILLHLRIQSNNTKIYNELAKIFQGFDDIMLGKEYSYENNGKNLGEVPLISFMNKVILIIDKTDKSFLDNEPLMTYINLTSSSNYLRVYRFSDFKNHADMNELIYFNKKAMTIILPDEDANPSNLDATLCREAGCQMVGMRYQYNDTNLKENTEFFDECGYAFCIKPSELR